jgi:aminobenzoyl-glutamate utilization protein B
MSIGDKGSVASAKIMAGIGHDLMTNADLRRSAKADLVRRRGEYKYVSPRPPEITRPALIPERLIKGEGDEILSEVNSGT